MKTKTAWLDGSSKSCAITCIVTTLIRCLIRCIRAQQKMLALVDWICYATSSASAKCMAVNFMGTPLFDQPCLMILPRGKKEVKKKSLESKCSFADFYFWQVVLIYSHSIFGVGSRRWELKTRRYALSHVNTHLESQPYTVAKSKENAISKIDVLIEKTKGMIIRLSPWKTKTPNSRMIMIFFFLKNSVRTRSMVSTVWRNNKPARISHICGLDVSDFKQGGVEDQKFIILSTRRSMWLR